MWLTGTREPFGKWTLLIVVESMGVKRLGKQILWSVAPLSIIQEMVLGLKELSQKEIPVD